MLLFVKRPNPWWLKGEGTHQAQTKFYLQQDIGSIYYIWHSGLYEHKDILFYPLQSNHFSLFFTASQFIIQMTLNIFIPTLQNTADITLFCQSAIY